MAGSNEAGGNNSKSDLPDPFNNGAQLPQWGPPPSLGKQPSVDTSGQPEASIPVVRRSREKGGVHSVARTAGTKPPIQTRPHWPSAPQPSAPSLAEPKMYVQGGQPDADTPHMSPAELSRELANAQEALKVAERTREAVVDLSLKERFRGTVRAVLASLGLGRLLK